jgi:hypothetical protein
MSTLSDPLVNVTPRSATALVERCFARTDQDLAALVESIRVLHSCRNGLARISRLPPEILVTVLRHFESFESHTSTSRHRGAPICLILTHVCRHSSGKNPKCRSSGDSYIVLFRHSSTM